MSHDRASWAIKNESILAELVAMIDLSAEEQRMLGSLNAAAQLVAPQMTDTFVERLVNHAFTAEYLDGQDMPRHRALVSGWFIELFSGRYDKAYVQRRLKIGQVHVRIGLPVRYPLIMLDVIMAYAEIVALQSGEPAKARAALRKILALDVAIFNQAYEDHQLHHLADLVGGERLARRILSDL